MVLKINPTLLIYPGYNEQMGYGGIKGQKGCCVDGPSRNENFQARF